MPYKDPEKRKEVKRKRREANRELGIKLTRLWQSTHKENTRASCRKWRAANADKIKEYNHHYAIANPDKVRANKLRRRAEKKNTIASLTKEQETLLKKSGCLFCGSHNNLTIAHDHPVSMGGNTTLGNTFCLCQSCNHKMHTKSLRDVMRQTTLPL